MPTLLDAVGILQNIGVYSVVLPFLLIFALSYALLDKTKVLGDNKFVHAAVSLVLAFLFVSSLGAVKFLTAFLPLISVLILIILFIILIFRFVGVQESSISSALSQSRVYSPIIIIIILFALIAFSQVFPEGALANRPELGDQFNITQPSSEGVEGLQAFLGEEQTRVFFSPSILSLIVLVIIFGVATYYITREPARGE
ncbi:MAG: hypothetical protein J4445_00545 [DPANN group archaeon]|nr:hypothetical protein [DPANN group archaeon]